MIRAIAMLLLLLGLLAMLPGGGAGAVALDDETRIRAEAVFEPLLRRANPAEPADEPGAPPVQPASLPAALAGRRRAAAPATLPWHRHRLLLRARSPPIRDVLA